MDIRAVRKRGGQPGNRNRLKHGRYSAAAKARRARREAELAPLFAAIEAALVEAQREIAFRRAFAATLRAETEAFLTCHGPHLRAMTIRVRRSA